MYAYSRVVDLSFTLRGHSLYALVSADSQAEIDEEVLEMQRTLAWLIDPDGKLNLIHRLNGNG